MADDVELDGLRAHDLPPRWNGDPVTWGPREDEPWTTLALHLPDRGACGACGSLARRTTRRGMVTSSGADFTLHAVRLLASRCGDCGQDVVVESTPGGDVEVWDLDPLDYGDAGSGPPAAASPRPPAVRGLPRRGPSASESIRRARDAVRAARETNGENLLTPDVDRT